MGLSYRNKFLVLSTLVLGLSVLVSQAADDTNKDVSKSLRKMIFIIYLVFFEKPGSKLFFFSKRGHLFSNSW